MSLNILAFFAHPDDETILAGGTLAALAEQGAHVHYVCATRGEGMVYLAGQIVASIKQFEIQAVLTHGSNGKYGHPAHLLCHQATVTALLSLPEEARPVLYTASASFPEHPYPRLTNENDPAHFVLDLTPVLDKKTNAALCHRTQHALFVRRRSEQAGRQLTVPEIIIPIEGVHRLLPAWMGEANDALAELLLRAGATLSPLA
jgi:LmbE family N-acetylglucosaminyl deacetylase